MMRVINIIFLLVEAYDIHFLFLRLFTEINRTLFVYKCQILLFFEELYSAIRINN